MKKIIKAILLVLLGLGVAFIPWLILVYSSSTLTLVQAQVLSTASNIFDISLFILVVWWLFFKKKEALPSQYMNVQSLGLLVIQKYLIKSAGVLAFLGIFVVGSLAFIAWILGQFQIYLVILTIILFFLTYIFRKETSSPKLLLIKAILAFFSSSAHFYILF